MPTSPVLPKLVGQRVKRREDPRLIQGRGTYVDDIALVGMQHLVDDLLVLARSDAGAGARRTVAVDLDDVVARHVRRLRADGRTVVDSRGVGPAQVVGGIDERRHWHTRCWSSRHAARP